MTATRPSVFDFETTWCICYVPLTLLCSTYLLVCGWKFAYRLVLHGYDAWLHGVSSQKTGIFTVTAVITSSLKLCARYIRNIGHEDFAIHFPSVCTQWGVGGGGAGSGPFFKRNHVYVSCGQTWCDDSWWLKCLLGEPWLLYAHVNLLVCEINSDCSAEAVSIHYSSTRRHLCKTRRHARSVTYHYPPLWVNSSVDNWFSYGRAKVHTVEDT
jgi:hypothetical protein